MGRSDLGFDVAALSDTGAVRAHNEDVVLVAPLDGESCPEVVFSFERAFAGPAVLAVCDGMGGAAAGEVASLEAARSIGHYLVSHHAADGDLGGAVIRSLRAASERVYDLAVANPRLSGMGTTATVCAVRGAEAIIGQVGDSRAYLLRAGELRQLTRDQTLAQLLMERGQLRPEDMDQSVVAGVILQAVGTAPSVDVDLKTIGIAAGDVLLLCSDGLSGALDAEVIREVLEEAPNASLACVRLIARALEAGATDNVTCIVARVLELDAART
ncbi:MAG: serine/threonine-protein phosphatase [Polyangiaceae bacterium]|nr:serine/threonine-protein phosphatase [Polyangiaceae bacterium]